MNGTGRCLRSVLRAVATSVHPVAFGSSRAPYAGPLAAMVSSVNVADARFSLLANDGTAGRYDRRHLAPCLFRRGCVPVRSVATS